MPVATSAEAAPFARLGAGRRTVEALARMGIETPTLIQERAIPPLVAGRDVIGQSRTGSGKTIAFGLPLIERLDPRLRRVQALVLVPTRELASQVADVLAQLEAGRGLKVAELIGQSRTGSGKTIAFGLPLIERLDPRLRRVQALVLVPTRELASQVADVLAQLEAGRGLKVAELIGGRSLGPQRDALRAGAQIAVGAPGRVLDHLRQGNLDLSAVRVVVLDEADQMLDAGFAPDVERILAATPRERQMALFTATLPEWTTKIAQRYLREPVRVDAGSPETKPAQTVEQTVYLVPDGCRLAALRALLDRRHEAEGTTLVFGRTKHGVKKLAKQLAAQGYPVAALQGNMSQNARDRVIADFRAGQVPILLATNVAARGLDVLSIEQVINYELPESAELFTHRVGRTGRMEREGEAITLLTAEDMPTWRRMQRDLGSNLPPRPWPQREMPLTAMPLDAPTAPPPAQRPVRASAPRGMGARRDVVGTPAERATPAQGMGGAGQPISRPRRWSGRRRAV